MNFSHLHQQILHDHDQYMTHNTPRLPIAVVRGEGCWVFDAQGKKYLDLFAGFGGSILGHCHPDLVAAVTQQSQTLWHVGNMLHSRPQTQLAKAISENGFGGQCFFCHCGSDANEAAIKLARLYGKARPGRAGARYRLITATHSFHGRLFGSMMATGQEKVRKGFEPLLEGFSYVPYDDLAAIEQACDDRTVAVMFEPIQGEGGIHVPGDDFFPGLRRWCDERDILLICDEVWTGAGRTGKFFAYQHWPIAPDIMTLAKGVGGGLPVGVMCAQPKVAEYLDPKNNHGIVAHGTTLGGNCLAMAVGAEVFHVIQRDGLLDRATKLGEHVKQRLTAFGQKNPAAGIRDVRGKGLFLGLELDPNAPGAGYSGGNDIVNRCLERGLMINATQGIVLRLAPPLNIRESELDQGLTILESALLTR